MNSEAWWTLAGLFVAVALLVGSIGHCSKVTSDCNRDQGVVVRDYMNLPTCIEKGQH
jgi:hypothetical protein